MELYEKINLLLKEKNLNKKNFALKLITLEPKLKNTGEIPSENTIYAYLNGRIGIKIELIPYIAEVLKVPEQLLFDDSAITRKMYLKHILATATNEEQEYIKSHLQNSPDKKFEKNKDNLNLVCELLKYAPEIFLENLENTLKNYKDLTLKFTK